MQLGAMQKHLQKQRKNMRINKPISDKKVTEKMDLPLEQEEFKNIGHVGQQRSTHKKILKEEATIDINDLEEVHDTDSTFIQSIITLLLSVILCITLSYLFVTFIGDKLAMHWMGV